MAGRERATAPPALASSGVHWRAWLAALARVVRVLQRIIGAPDYDAYLAHHARCHPGEAPLSCDDFILRRQEDRYSRPGARCC